VVGHCTTGRFNTGLCSGGLLAGTCNLRAHNPTNSSQAIGQYDRNRKYFTVGFSIHHLLPYHRYDSPNYPKNKMEEELDESRFSSKALEDFQLIDRAVGGDDNAYAKLLQRYKRAVYHMILKMVRNIDDAEDLTIESFAKAFKSLHRFKKDYTFSTWLFRIATNNTIDYIRKKKLNTLSIENTYTDDDGQSVSIDVEDENNNPQEETIRAQKAELLLIFVDKLPAKYQKLVRLRYYEELSYEEIAERIEAPLGTVKAQLHRARELMYEMVKNKRDHI
jgi:RNA polymerase sigma factor (sigma-70 family)